MNKKSKPFLAHSELTDCIYIIDGKDKYDATEQCINAMKATNRIPNTDKYKQAIRALADTYNYFDDGFLLNLRNDIYNNYLRGNSSYVIEEFPDNGMDTLIYSWLIMMYGDYGTSPKVGWIEDLPGAVKWLDEFMEDWKHGD